MLRKIVLVIFAMAVIVVSGCQQQMTDKPSVQQKKEQIAFSRLTDGYWQLWGVWSDGTGLKQLTYTPSDKRYPVWADNGSKVLFRTNNNMVYSLDINTGQETRMLKSMGLLGGVLPSPVANNQVAFVRYRTDIKDSSDLWTSSLNGENRRIVARSVGLQYDPAWSPDGQKIAYIAGHGYQTHELYVVNSDGTNKQRLTENKALELLPAFSPDGKILAYVSDITDNYEIWFMNHDGSNPRQVTHNPGLDTKPCWSSDGDKIVFVSNRSDQMQLWIMNSDGSELRQITTGAPSMDPALRKDQ